MYLLTTMPETSILYWIPISLLVISFLIVIKVFL